MSFEVKTLCCSSRISVKRCRDSSLLPVSSASRVANAAAWNEETPAIHHHTRAPNAVPPWSTSARNYKCLDMGMKKAGRSSTIRSQHRATQQIYLILTPRGRPRTSSGWSVSSRRLLRDVRGVGKWTKGIQRWIGIDMGRIESSWQLLVHSLPTSEQRFIFHRAFLSQPDCSCRSRRHKWCVAPPPAHDPSRADMVGKAA